MRIAALALLLVGCSTLDLQRARTVGAGNFQTTVAAQGAASLYQGQQGTAVGRSGLGVGAVLRYGLSERIDVSAGGELAFVPTVVAGRFEAGGKWAPWVTEHLAVSLVGALGVSIVPYAKLAIPFGATFGNGTECVLTPTLYLPWGVEGGSTGGQLALIHPILPGTSVALQLSASYLVPAPSFNFERFHVHGGVGVIFGDSRTK